MKPKKQEPRPPIGEEIRLGRDQMWNPRLDRIRMTMSDIADGSAAKPDRTPSPKPKARTLPEIVALVEEMRQVWGDCPAVKAYEQKLYEEGGFIAIPKGRKSFEDAMDEAEGQDE